MQITIQSGQQTWQSPDGQRKLYEVTYTDANGNLVKNKTWSGKIGTGVGQTFNIETYEKQGNRGPETFVRQLQDPNSQYASSGASGNSGQVSTPGAAPAEKQFKGDPDTRASIERQTVLKAAVEIVGTYYGTVGVQPAEGFNLNNLLEDVGTAVEKLTPLATAVPSAVAEVFPGAEPVADEPFPSNPPNQPQQDSLV